MSEAAVLIGCGYVLAAVLWWFSKPWCARCRSRVMGRQGLDYDWCGWCLERIWP